jgi:hypothetical protein
MRPQRRRACRLTAAAAAAPWLAPRAQQARGSQRARDRAAAHSWCPWSCGARRWRPAWRVSQPIAPQSARPPSWSPPPGIMRHCSSVSAWTCIARRCEWLRAPGCEWHARAPAPLGAVPRIQPPPQAIPLPPPRPPLHRRHHHRPQHQHRHRRRAPQRGAQWAQAVSPERAPPRRARRNPCAHVPRQHASVQPRTATIKSAAPGQRPPRRGNLCERVARRSRRLLRRRHVALLVVALRRRRSHARRNSRRAGRSNSDSRCSRLLFLRGALRAALPLVQQRRRAAQQQLRPLGHHRGDVDARKVRAQARHQRARAAREQIRVSARRVSAAQRAVDALLGLLAQQLRRERHHLRGGSEA